MDHWVAKGFCAAVNDEGLRCGRARHEDEDHEWFDHKAALKELMKS